MHSSHCVASHHDHVHTHSGSGLGMGHGSAQEYLRRFWIVTGLLVVFVALDPRVAAQVGLPVFTWYSWGQFVLATAIFRFSLVFFVHARHEIKARQYGMMTLVSLAVGSGYIFSVFSTFMPSIDAAFYLEISTLVWVLLFGHYLEAKSGAVAGDALSKVAALLPKQAHKLEGAQESAVPVSELQAGDMVRVKPGEKIPADGDIMQGTAHIDESLVSGESTPVAKAEGQGVVAGAICLDGTLTVRLTRVGAHSTVGQIQKLIAQAGKTKPRSQKIADRASAVLTLVAGVTALGTLLVWFFVLGKPFVFAVTLAITVLVITCPHALGLAIPTVTTIATSLAVKHGFFIKDLSKIEVIRNAEYVVFDKTGTLTTGVFGVSEVVAMDGYVKDDVLRMAASLEQYSSHIIAQAILDKARVQSSVLSKVVDFENVAGQGIVGVVNGQKYYVGSRRFIETVVGEQVLLSSPIGTTVFVATDTTVMGYLVLSDTIKPSARVAVQALHMMGIRVALLTGDSTVVAEMVAKELGIDTFFAEVLPADKYRFITELQKDGNVVLMVGDGVNDAPALSQADAGVAIGAGTDIAVEAGDVVLVDSDPQDIVRLIKLSKKVYIKMIQNLVWAFGYNIIAIPAAAGVFAYWGFYLRPEIGAFVMSLSTVIVVANAMMLRRLSFK